MESFAPDFYLPEFDLYVELTTLKQSLVRKKNRKLRRLRELYPDVRIKLFYARDFKALLLKYGRIDLAASLSGEEGQARPAEAASLVDAASAVSAGSADLVPPVRQPRSPSAGRPRTRQRHPRPRPPRPVRHRRSRRARRRRRAAAVT